MLEARNLRNLTAQQTPLLGDENTPMHSIPGRGTGFDGATPRSSVSATPNPLATPLRRAGLDGSATPLTDAGSLADGQTPLRTPMRDTLNINAEDATPYDVRSRSSLRSLQEKLKSLPAPKNDFELVDPEDEEIKAQEAAALREEDAAERDARNAAAHAEEQRKNLARRSQVIKRNLPRPTEFNASAILSSLDANTSGAPEDILVADITREMVRLLEHDSILYPVAGGSKVGGGKSRLEMMPDEDLEAARHLVHNELASSIGFPGASEEVVQRTIASSVDLDSFNSTWKPLHDSLAYDAKSKSYVDKSSLSAIELNAGRSALINSIRQNMMLEVSKAMKAEKKLGLTLGGYQSRNRTLGNKLVDLSEELTRARFELESFTRLAEMEDGASKSSTSECPPT